MPVATSRDALTIGVAALAGAVVAARWWAHRLPQPQPGNRAVAADRVEELHLAFRDRTVPHPDDPENALRRYWSRLHPLTLTPTA
ncbi:hypothetical protein [Streptomyces glaucus]|uniref:Secreted protein n=1 Tax=Streptomyces glaucus TaxID=284029 RepID=A0ABN3K709_9ACTN